MKTRDFGLLLALAGVLALPACVPLEAQAPGLPDLGGLLESAIREEAAEALAEALGIELLNEEGEHWGEVVIDEFGISIFDAQGNLAMRLDPTGSIHNVPETFNRELILNGGMVLPTQDGGEVVISAHVLGALLQELMGGMDERPNAPREIRAGSIFPDLVETGKVTVDLANGGVFVVDGAGVRILDDEGKVLWSVDEEGSRHAMPEEFAGGITIPLNSGGKVVIDEVGITVLDESGELKGIINDGGSMLFGEVFPEYVTTKRVTVDMANGNKIITDETGIRIVDKDGNVLWSVDENGSKHAMPEEFAGGITIPLNSGGKVVIDEVGITVLDENGELKGIINDGGTMLFGEVMPEYVTTKRVTIDMGGGTSLISDENGIRIVDKDGNVLWSVDENGSRHNIPETFTEIRMPLVDDDGNSQGTMVMDREGLWIEDSGGNVVYALDERASMHLMPEEFASIIVPQKDGTNLVIDENGIHHEDKEGNTIPSPPSGDDTSLRVPIISEGVALDTTGREILLEESWLFDFLEGHPGLEHFGGVERGGSFIFVYGDETAAKGDLLLPYLWRPLGPLTGQSLQGAFEFREGSDGVSYRNIPTVRQGCIQNGLGGEICFTGGGLIQTDALGEEISRLPNISGIPLIGSPFKACTQTRNETQVCIFVTPALVKAGE